MRQGLMETSASPLPKSSVPCPKCLASGQRTRDGAVPVLHRSFRCIICGYRADLDRPPRSDGCKAIPRVIAVSVDSQPKTVDTTESLGRELFS